MRSRLLSALPVGGSLPAEVWAQRQRTVVVLVWLHAVGVPVYARVMGFGILHTVLETMVLPVAAVAAGSSWLPRRARTIAGAAGLLSASAVLVHLSGGLIEMHFHFFVMLMVISLYQDWATFLLAIGYVVVHHGVAGVVDPGSVYNHAAAQRSPWKWAAVHAFFIAGASAGSLVNWRLNERHLAERRKAEERLLEERRIVEQLNEVGRTLASDLELDHVLQRVTDLATELTSAEFGAFLYDAPEESGEMRRLHTVAGPLAESLAGTDAPQDITPLAARFAARRVERIEDAAASAGPWAATDGRAHPILRSHLAVPVTSRGAVVGGLFFGHTQPGRFTIGDERIAVGVAAHAAVAVENARLFANQRRAAETLQHALLPDRLPVIPGVEMAVRYVPAGEGADVGGDWYDVIALGDGRVAVVMGDVVGHGIPAASLMGQLRNALRAYALDGHGPAAVLSRLNAFIEDLGATDQMATAFFGVFDPGTGLILYANAGHPPPVIRGHGGDTALVEGALGVPLGAVAGYEYAQGTAVLVPGATLVLYTDGLVEGSGLRLDHGIDLLMEALADDSGDPEAQCDRLLRRLEASRKVTDDTALLVLRPVPLGDRLRLVVPADPAALRPLRSLLRRWLDTSDARSQDSFEILLATIEACSNVVRHGRFPGTDTFLIEAERGHDISIRVRNQGRWRAATGAESGGRGLAIITEFMDEVEVVRGPPETVVSMRRAVSRPLVG